jgi:hypothetical protein
VTLDTRLTCSAHVNQVRKRAAQRLGILVPLLNRRSSLSVRNGVLLYKQLIRPMMDYACPICRSAALNHVKNCKCYNPSAFALLPAHRGTLVTGKHEDLGIPFFADHIRALTESFDSKLADAGNPLVRQLGRHLCRLRADWIHLGNRGDLTSSRPAVAVPQKTAKSAQLAVPGLLCWPGWGFPCFYSVVWRKPGHNEKRGTARLPFTEAFSRNNPPKSQRPSAKTTRTLPGSTPRKTIQPKSLYEG